MLLTLVTHEGVFAISRFLILLLVGRRWLAPLRVRRGGKLQVLHPVELVCHILPGHFAGRRHVGLVIRGVFRVTADLHHVTLQTDVPL